MNMNTINIAFITDNNYSLCTNVAICSLKTHRSLNRKYQIFVVYDGLNWQCLQKFKMLSEADFNVICIDSRKTVKATRFERQKYVRHVSSTATYKFYLAKILPDVDKVLYIDGDTLMRDGLEELFDTDIDNVYAAVCQDIGAEVFPSNYKERLKINHRYYFNSGVMLLNLKKIRDEQLYLDLVDYRIQGTNDYMDQDAFNVVFSDNVIFFDLIYNMVTSCWTKYGIDDLNAYYHKQFFSKADCYTQARILHLATPEKPWIYSDVIASEEWLIYYLNSPMYSADFNRKLIGNSKYKSLIQHEMDYYSAVSNIASNMRTERTEAPVVSVIIPVYNSAQHLEECIESLLLQSLKNVEFIFVDDSSADDSTKIISMFSNLDNRIRLFQQTHGGAGKARNLGIKQAKGKYITFLDSDDILICTALEDLYKKIISTGSDVAICDCAAFSEDKSKTWKYESSLKPTYLPVGDVFSINSYSDYLFQMTDGQVWGKMFRVDVIRDNNISFPVLQRSEDIPFTCIALAFAKKITILKKQLVLHRVISGSNSLEEAKDKNPSEVDSALCILWERIVSTGQEKTLYKTFINKAVSSYYYNFTTMTTAEGFSKLYLSFKETVNKVFAIPFENESMFYDSNKVEYLKEVFHSESVQECLFAQLKETRGKNKELKDDYNMNAYRIGCAITWAPRKFRGGIQCYKDNGLKYTINRFFEHLSGKAEK